MGVSNERENSYLFAIILSLSVFIVISMKTLFILFVVIIGIKDYISFYFSFWWLIPSLFFLIIQIVMWGWSSVSVSCALFYGSMAFLFYKKGWMGLADVGFLFYFGFLLGWIAMMEVHFISVLVGLLFSLIKKETYIPYVSCLCIGVLYILVMRFSFMA